MKTRFYINFTQLIYKEYMLNQHDLFKIEAISLHSCIPRYILRIDSYTTRQEQGTVQLLNWEN